MNTLTNVQFAMISQVNSAEITATITLCQSDLVDTNFIGESHPLLGGGDDLNVILTQLQVPQQ
jgi:hypothetical protein